MKECKNVVFIINNLGMGGAENMLIGQLAALDRNIFKPYLITILPNPETGVIERVPEDVEFIQLKFKSVFDIFSFYKLWRLLKREKFVGVVTSLFNANLFGRIAAILAGVPVILSSELNVLEDKKSWQIIADRFLARWTKKILVSSNEVLDFTSKQENLPREKFQLNFNAIPLKLGEIKKTRAQVLTKMGLPVNETYIVTAGSFTPQKGQSYLIEAADKLKKQGVKNFKVLIFGRGVLGDKLSKQVKTLGLEDEVRFTGISTMEEILAISDIFTLPSLWEGLSIALLQSMDAGCPIVATRISGTNEVFQNGKNALIVEPGDSEELAHALKRVLEDKNLREKLAQGAQERVKEFSIEKNVKVIEDLILSK